MSTKKPTRTTTTVEITTTARARIAASLQRVGLSSEEERVVRTRRGLGAALDEPLSLKHTETDKARAALMAIEREMVMKMHARVSEERAKKSKIVDTLRGTKKR